MSTPRTHKVLQDAMTRGVSLHEAGLTALCQELETEAARLSNGYHNILAEFEKAPGLPLETLSQDDLAKWTDIITGILKALGPFSITGKPISLGEYLDATLEPK